MANLTSDDIKALVYSLTEADERGDADALLARKLERVNRRLGTYLDTCKENPDFRDEIIQTALDRYLLPNFGLIAHKLVEQAKSKKGSVASIKQITELLSAVSKVLKANKPGKTENHLHLYSKMNEQALVEQMESDKREIDELLGRVRGRVAQERVETELDSILDQVKASKNGLGKDLRNKP